MTGIKQVRYNKFTKINDKQARINMDKRVFARNDC